MDELIKRLRAVRATEGIWAPGLLPSAELVNQDGPAAAYEIERLRALLARYRDETPLGNQPHMIAHEVDAALGRK
jgi:hypothetical protein